MTVRYSLIHVTSKVIALVLVPMGLFSIAYYAWGYFLEEPEPVALEHSEDKRDHEHTLDAIDILLPGEARGFVDTSDPNDLLPDLLPLPPRDVKVERSGDLVFLYFSTTYYNQGRGDMELRADQATAGVEGDVTRTVLQRIYQADGEHREKPVGTFLWHDEHLHYHFSDFITYDLEPVDAPDNGDLSGKLVKSTFCLRDVSRVHLDTLASSLPDATYTVCGKERQGVSVGWGDTYFWNYPGQALNITGLASGTYRLTFVVNPDNMLEEVRYDNNTASALFKLDMENTTIEVLEEVPAHTPEVEHIHLESPFGVNYSQ